jgi:hypothetical protein
MGRKNQEIYVLLTERKLDLHLVLKVRVQLILGLTVQPRPLMSAKLEFLCEAGMEQDTPMLSRHQRFVQLIEKHSFLMLR